jgi:hypothetical protein
MYDGLNSHLVGATGDIRNAGPQDSSLVTRNLRQGVSKKTLMISGDLGNDGHSLVVEDVGTVEPAAHADFDNANLDLSIIEYSESCRSQNLKRRGADFFPLVDCLVMSLDYVEFSFRDALAIDGDAVPSRELETITCTERGTHLSTRCGEVNLPTLTFLPTSMDEA